MNLKDLELVDVERLEVKPGEALVLKYPGRLSEAAAGHIKSVAESVFKGLDIPILVLSDGLELAVVANG